MTSSTKTDPRLKSSSPWLRKRRLVFLLALVCVMTLAIGGGWIWMLHTGLARARQHMARKEWSDARTQLSRYFRLYPADAEAHLLMAESYVKDETDTEGGHIDHALSHLQTIPNDSEFAAKARLQEARLRFLIRFQPTKAEALLRKSLQLDGESFEANYLMWKLADLSGRHYLSRPYFWKVYDLSPADQKAIRLREWFLSEFFPESANADYDRLMGVVATKTLPVVIVRFLKFREAEPESPVNHAVLAWYFVDSKDPKSAVKLLEMASDLEVAMANPLYVSVLFEALLDLGEFDKATACFRSWPKPRTGYDYWRCQGLWNQLIRKDDRAAVVCFEKALKTPQGPLDWPTMSRLADSLSRIGRSREAKAVRNRIDRLTKTVLTPDTISSIRKTLQNIRNIDTARKVRDFYGKLGLKRESRAWEQHRQRLLKRSAVVTRQPTVGISSPGQ